MSRKSRGRGIDTLFVMVIFAVFAFSVLMVLTLGAGVYRNINDMTHEQENERMALSYVRTKVRNSDNAGAVGLVSFDGRQALRISENIGGTEYKTVIYVYDGWLCEIFTEASMTFSPQDGMPVVQVGDLQFSEPGAGLIEARAADMFILLSLRSGEEIVRQQGAATNG